MYIIAYTRIRIIRRRTGDIALAALAFTYVYIMRETQFQRFALASPHLSHPSPIPRRVIRTRSEGAWPRVRELVSNALRTLSRLDRRARARPGLTRLFSALSLYLFQDVERERGFRSPSSRISKSPEPPGWGPTLRAASRNFQ